MGHKNYKYDDACDWCGKGTNKIQHKPGTDIWLCPECCPDIDEDDLPDTDTLPSAWHFLSEEEREMWLDGMTVEEIGEENDWLANYEPVPRTES